MYIGEWDCGLMYWMNKEEAYNDLSGGRSLRLSTPGRGSYTKHFLHSLSASTH